ncbi:hypothetical protein D3C86_1856260 [compost metagenome]
MEEHSYIWKLITEADCGIAVRPKDVDSLETALRQLYENRARVLQMGRNARALFDANFTLDQAVRTYRDVVERTIASSSEKFDKPIHSA